MGYRTKVVLWLVVLILALLANEFRCEIFAIGWHVGHGRTVQLKSVDNRHAYYFEAPLMYSPRLDEMSWDATLVRRPGPVRAQLLHSDWAMMSFSADYQYLTAEETRRAATTFSKNAGLDLTQIATLNVAGQDLYCFERRWEKGRMSELSRTMPMVDIMCVPLSDKHSLSASYDGTRKYLPDFYNVLQGVKRLN
jgi:hypothetical protein